MLEKTQTEQTELKTRVSEGRKWLSDEVQLANDAKQWVEAIQEYANITELDAATPVSYTHLFHHSNAVPLMAC